MTVEYMLITGPEFNYDNIIYLMSLKIFNGGNISMYESKYGIFITCGFEIGKRELNKLRHNIKKNTGAKYVDCRINEK
jgi:hypothetical protein